MAECPSPATIPYPIDQRDKESPVQGVERTRRRMEDASSAAKRCRLMMDAVNAEEEKTDDDGSMKRTVSSKKPCLQGQQMKAKDGETGAQEENLAAEEKENSCSRQGGCMTTAPPSSTKTNVDPAMEEILVQLLQRERDLRVSPASQKEMELAEKWAHSEWMDVATKIQHQVVRQHNNSAVGGSKKVTVHELRLAALRHPEIAFWVKYNRARQGTLRVGDVAPNISLRRAHDNSATTLFDAGNHQRTVIVAGSWS
ncbi:expressed unknown protein [Seminavis robusta]|uniref:Uncharacterized protein n=1 Tax=Seminavis robusta TaxID=568900 RepID=A0A9N8DMQ1_9STRA|nr:expressed unknown protein [Seminavis robusta]|eukprot:Sro247_g098000.1 n/a (255) ;mRNA; r:16976-17740